MSEMIARAALRAWGYEDTVPLTLLSDANNAIYRADLPNVPAILRVHRPQNKTRVWIEAELRLLIHLNTAALHVPRPLADVIEVETRTCTLLSYLEGKIKPVPDWYALLANHGGILLGKIHQAAQTFTLQPEIDRPRLDAETLFSQSTQYALDSEGQVLLEPYADIFSRVQDNTAAALKGLEALGILPQVIHGDYKPDNLLWANLVPSAVDFDDCAWGNPAYDMATLWLFLRSHSRYAQLKVYAARAWCAALKIDDSPALMAHIETLVTARIALSCRWVAGNRNHPNFIGRAAEVIRERLMTLAV